MVRAFKLLLTALLLPLVALGQNTLPPRLVPSPPVSGIPDREITLAVQVTDKSGASIRGLQKQDFTLLDDKQPQTILEFHAVDGGASDTPVEIVLVVDAVNAGFQTVSYERDEVKKFLLQNGGKLAQPVSLIVFTDAGTDVQKVAIRDGNALAALYDQSVTGLRTIHRSQGFYGAADRFAMSLKTLSSLVSYEATRPGRKLMIWISPGWPLLSGPNIQISRTQSQQIFDSIVATSTALRQARVTLYSIDPLGVADAGGMRTSYYKQFVKGVSSASRAEPGNLGLQVLAQQSGGRVVNSSNDLTAAVANCAKDAEAYYVVSFAPSAADQANEYHALSVAVDKPGVTARTSTGYYAQPQSSLHSQ